MAETILWIIADSAALVVIIIAVKYLWKEQKALNKEIKEFEKRKHQN